MYIKLTSEMEEPAGWQHYLDWIAKEDKHGFLKEVSTWGNHRTLLLLALSLTEGNVIELGAGFDSTPFLEKYCADAKRYFYSYDNSQEWAEKFGAKHVLSWNDCKLWQEECSLLFVDCAPGEVRHEIIALMANKADIIVIHDTEENSAGDYMLDKIWPLFKYRLNLNKTGGGAGASAVSNKIDLHQFAGCSFGSFKFEL